MTQSVDLGAIANVPGATFRQRINTGFQAALSHNYGPGEPPVVYPNMMWYGSATGRAFQRNTENTMWIDLGPIGTQVITPVERAKLAKFVTLDSFGGVGDATTDNATALQNALAALPGGGTLYVPPGSFAYTPPLNVPDGVKILGHSNYSSVLIARDSGSTCINLGLSCSITDIHLTASTIRSGGAMVSITKNACVLDRFTMTNYYVGVNVVGTPSALVVGARICNGTMFSPSVVPNGAAITFQNFSSAYVSDTIIAGPVTGVQPTRSIQIRHGDTIFLSRVNATKHGTFGVQPIGAAEGTFSLTVTDCYFDSATGSAAEFVPVGGAIKNTVIQNTWFGLSGGHGCAVSSTTGQVDGIEFQSCQFLGNSGGSGLAVVGPNVRNLAVIGGHAAGNVSNGLHFDRVTHFCVMGFRAGNVAERGDNGGSGIFVTGACDAYRLIANDLVPDGLNDSGTGSVKFLAFNIF